MLTISDAAAAVLATKTQATFARFSIKDGDSNWRNMCTYPGFDSVKQLSWKAAINDPHATFDAVLAREVYQLSLSPFMEDSPLNHAFDPAEDFEPLIKLNREVKIEVAVVPIGSTPEDSDYRPAFHGRIDELDAAAGDDIKLSGRDLGGRLAQQYIKQERVYAFASDGGMVSLRVWKPQMPIYTSGVDQYILPNSRGADDSGYNKFYQGTIAGTAGTTEPTWIATTNDGSGQWGETGEPTLTGFPLQEVIQKILDDNLGAGDSAVSLYTVSDPLWDVTEFMQNRGFTLEAVRALASQIGWDLRYKWKAGLFGSYTSEFTLYEPDRDSPSVVHEFEPSDYREPTRLALNIAQIRISVLVNYKDREDLWPNGSPKRKEVRATDPDSIDEFGELWSELQEDENSNIDTEEEAERLAAAFISDCAWPTAEVAIPLARGFPWVELNDFYRFKADNVRSSEDLELAVTAWQQDFSDGELSTKLSLRGTPTAGHQVHIDKEYHPGKPPKNLGHRLEHFPAPTTVNPNFREIVGGIYVEFNHDFTFPTNSKKTELLTQYEIHVGTEPDFLPDETTLVAVINGTSQSIPYQDPNGPNPNGGGEDYYGRAVPNYFNAGQLVRGQPSISKAFKAGRASAAHIHEAIGLGEYPLNGGFETRTNPNGMPDWWTLVSGVFGDDATVTEDDVHGMSGTRTLRLIGGQGIDPVVRSARIPVVNEVAAEFEDRLDGVRRLTFWLSDDEDNNNDTDVVAKISLYDQEGVLLTTETVVTVNLQGLVDDKWKKYEHHFSLSEYPDARSISVTFQMDYGSGNAVCDIDEVRVQYLGTMWQQIITDGYVLDTGSAINGFSNDWDNYGSPHEFCAIRKDSVGRVWMKGLAASPDDTLGSGNALFTLPAQYRPKEQIHLSTVANGKHACLEIDTSGVVFISFADSATWNDWVSIDCSFETFAHAGIVIP